MAEPDYDRGRLDGEIQATLKEHGSRLGKVESTLGRFQGSIEAVGKAVARVESAIAEDRATTKATADALLKKREEDDAELERKLQEAQFRWTPFSIAVTAVLAVGAVATVVIQIVSLHG